jgi:hypothetical protein
MYEFYCHLWFLAIPCNNGETKSFAQQSMAASLPGGRLASAPRYEAGAAAHFGSVSTLRQNVGHAWTLYAIFALHHEIFNLGFCSVYFSINNKYNFIFLSFIPCFYFQSQFILYYELEFPEICFITGFYDPFFPFRSCF